MDSEEISEWISYNSIDPLGTFREDYRFGMLISILINMFKDANDKSVTPFDFMVFKNAYGIKQEDLKIDERSANELKREETLKILEELTGKKLKANKNIAKDNK